MTSQAATRQLNRIENSLDNTHHVKRADATHGHELSIHIPDLATVALFISTDPFMKHSCSVSYSFGNKRGKGWHSDNLDRLVETFKTQIETFNE